MTVLEFEYAADYPGPALPVVEVDVRGPAGSRHVTALVDSGADATLIPLRILEEVDTPVIDTRWARNITGGRYRVAMYLADLSIGPLRFPATEVIANHQTDEIVLGRDVLNQLITILDGPAGVVSITR